MALGSMVPATESFTNLLMNCLKMSALNFKGFVYFRIIPSLRLENNALLSGLIGTTSATSASSLSFWLMILAKHLFSSLLNSFAGSKPLFLLKISAQNSKFKSLFSPTMSAGERNFGTPREAASLMTFSALSSSDLSRPDLSHWIGSS